MANENTNGNGSMNGNKGAIELIFPEHYEVLNLFSAEMVKEALASRKNIASLINLHPNHKDGEAYHALVRLVEQEGKLAYSVRMFSMKKGCPTLGKEIIFSYDDFGYRAMLRIGSDKTFCTLECKVED